MKGSRVMAESRLRKLGLHLNPALFKTYFDPKEKGVLLTILNVFNATTPDGNLSHEEEEEEE